MKCKRRCIYTKTTPHNDVTEKVIFVQPGRNLRLNYYFRLENQVTETEVHEQSSGEQ